MCFIFSFIGVKVVEEDISRSVLDDDDRVYWYHLVLPDGTEKSVIHEFNLWNLYLHTILSS
jgi:hypothetical protein